MLTLLYPGMLLGTAAVGIPWLIHLLLRPRPRRVIFPALRFARPALSAGRRAGRLRELALLALRGLALAAAILALAGPTCRLSANSTGELLHEVILLDDSLSTAYLLEQRSAFDELRGRASARLRAALPKGFSRTLILASASGSDDGDDPLSRLSSASPRGVNALGASLRRAGDVLARRDGRRRLVILTDLAAHALRDVDASWAPPALRAELAVDVVVARDSAPANTFAAMMGNPGRFRADAAFELQLDVRTASVPSGASIALQAGERAIGRSGHRVFAKPRESLTLNCEPLPAGLHALLLVVEPNDRLMHDQERYVAIETGSPPRARLIAPEQPTLTARILENLLAPTGIPTEALGWQFERVTAPLAGIGVDQSGLIVLIEPAQLGADDISTLRAEAALGSHVLIVPPAPDAEPGERTPNVAWSALAREFFGGEPELLEAELSCSWRATSRLPFADPGFDELARCRIRRAWQVVPAPAAGTEATLSNGAPLLLSLRRGRGATWLLTTSPAPAWSDLGSRAAPLLSVLHTLGDFSRRAAARTAEFEVQRSDRRTFPGLPADGLVSVARVMPEPAQPQWVRIAGGVPERDWPSDEPGAYEVRTAAADPVAALYAVNWPAEESDLTPLDHAEVSTRLGVEGVRVLTVSDDGAASMSAEKPFAAMEPGQVVAAALLVLLVLESILAGARTHARALSSP
ncbi:MAG: hypothetical protein CHACPFDD_03617 [Phycisphaerae bacterium]|nr:hypothetical protein [Phycisphaerae bacterium]